MTKLRILNQRSILLATALIILVQSVLSQGARAVDFFVSKHGKDVWSGKRDEPGEDDGPFATIERAQQAVWTIRKTDPQAAVRVIIRGGTYYLDSPLEFGPEDSGTQDAPVIYAAAPGEKVVISGRCPERPNNEK